MHDLKTKLDDEVVLQNLERDKEARRKAEKPSKQQLFTQFLFNGENLAKLSASVFELIELPVQNKIENQIKRSPVIQQLVTFREEEVY